MRKIDVPDNEHELEDHDRGLSFDLSTMSRRRSLMLLGGAGLAGLAGLAACTPDTDNGGGTTTTAGPTTTDATTTTTAGATTTTATGSCTVIPSETGGPRSVRSCWQRVPTRTAPGRRLGGRSRH